MLKSFVRRSAIVLTLTLIAAPIARTYAQEPSPIVSGGNPMPTGEDTPAIFVIIPLLIALASA
jgi:hypothetical protein